MYPGSVVARHVGRGLYANCFLQRKFANYGGGARMHGLVQHMSVHRQHHPFVFHIMFNPGFYFDIQWW